MNANRKMTHELRCQIRIPIIPTLTALEMRVALSHLSVVVTERATIFELSVLTSNLPLAAKIVAKFIRRASAYDIANPRSIVKTNYDIKAIAAARKTAILARYLDGSESAKDVAESIGCTPANVYQVARREQYIRAYRARKEDRA